MKTDKQTNAIHAHHRERIRRRFLRSGMDDMADHEILELLLTFAIPRKDVNPLAHTLVQRFNSLSGVLDASVEDLCTVDGVGESTAMLLSMFPQLFRRYEKDRLNPKEAYDTLPKMGALARSLFVGETIEKLYLLLFDNGMHLMNTVLIAEGTVNSVSVSIRAIVQTALKSQAACAVLTHNHPHGLALPSHEDISLTTTVDSAMDMVEVPLLEHIIVSDYSYAATMRNLKGSLRSAPGVGQPDENFYRRFYGMDAEQS